MTLMLMNDKIPVASVTEKFADALTKGPSTAAKLKVMATEIRAWVEFAVELQNSLGVEVRLDQIERGPK
jgi:hypothetical protein